MKDLGGAEFSLMYLPNNTVGLPTPVGAIVQVTEASRSALGLSAAWDVPLAGPAPTGGSQALVLYAVYGFGETPSL